MKTYYELTVYDDGMYGSRKVHKRNLCSENLYFDSIDQMKEYLTKELVEPRWPWEDIIEIFENAKTGEWVDFK